MKRKKEQFKNQSSTFSRQIQEVFGVKIELHSNTEAIIEGCSNVTDYYEDRIKFNLHNRSVTFFGNNLAIVSFYDGVAIIRGEITSVEWTD